MNTPNIIALSAPVAIEASDTKRVPTFEATIYTGGSLEIAGWDLPVVIDLGGLTAGNVLVANLDHDSSQRVGNFQIENDGRTLLARGVASAATAARDEVVNSAKDGYVWQASIEVAPKRIETIKAGESLSINNRQVSGPIHVTRAGVIKGFAFVSHGADDDTSVRIAATKRGRSMTSEFQSWVESCMPTVNFGDFTESQLANLHANYSGRSETKDSDFEAVAPLMIHASGDPVEMERKRLRQIEAAIRGDWKEQGERVAELRASAIGGELSIDQLIEQMRDVINNKYEAEIPMAQTVYAPPRADQHAQVIEASYALAFGLANVEKHYSEQTLDCADKLRGSVSLHQMILAEADKNGERVRPGERLTQGNMLRFMRAAFTPIRGSGFSTYSLPTTLSNIANKFMNEGFNSVDTTILRVAAIKPVTNFKDVTTIALTGGMTFKPLGPGGMIEHGSVGETVYTNRADTYAIMFGIDRTALINDDASVLSSIPRRIGRGAMLKLNDMGWSLFMNNATFFTSARGNLVGAGSKLGLIGIAMVEQAFINQVDPDGAPLGIMPAILLVPPSQKGTGLSLMNSQTVVTGENATLPGTNIWQARFTVESTPYLQNASYTGFSQDACYLLANPNQMPVLEIAALNGRIEPVVETASVDFDQLGLNFRGYSDVGVAMPEYRGGVKATGLP